MQSNNVAYRDQRPLPPIYTNGSPGGERRSSGYHDSISPVANGHPVGYPPNGMPPQDFRHSYNGMGTYSNGMSFESMGDYGDGKTKKRRGNLPKHVTDILRIWFTDHLAHPYPTEDEKQALMQQTGLSISQVSHIPLRCASALIERAR